MRPEEYEQYVHFYSDYVPPMLADLLKGVPSPSAKPFTLVDIGCGDGALLYAPKAGGYLRGKRVLAVDHSEQRLRSVRLIDPEIQCISADAAAIPEIQAKECGLVLCTQVIEHVPDDAKMIGELARILAPGGRVYLSTVFKKWYGWYFYRCNGKWVLDPTHLREYSRDDQLLGLLEKAGFRVESMRKSLFWFPVVDFFLRRFGCSSRKIFTNRILRGIRSAAQVPIFGYYNWELQLSLEADREAGREK